MQFQAYFALSGVQKQKEIPFYHIILTGPRGVGKTTLILQYIKENLPREQSLYVTAEDFYFAGNKLVDLADEFEKTR